MDRPHEQDDDRQHTNADRDRQGQRIDHRPGPREQQRPVTDPERDEQEDAGAEYHVRRLILVRGRDVHRIAHLRDAKVEARRDRARTGQYRERPAIGAVAVPSESPLPQHVGAPLPHPRLIER